MAVFEEYYDPLTGLIGSVDENSFCLVAGKLFTKKIIDQTQKAKATREGLMPGAQILINRVISYVKQKDEAERTAKVLKVLGEVEWLKDIVTKMKGYHPPPIPKVKSKEDTDGTDKFKVFISYTRREGQEHMDCVEQLYQNLNTDEKLCVFKDDQVLVAGEKLTPRLKQEITECSLFVSVMSDKYFDSEWCYEEFEYAHKEKKDLFPIVCDNGSRNFKYPDKIKTDFPGVGDILRHSLYSEERNRDTEIAKCVTEIVRFINILLREN